MIKFEDGAATAQGTEENVLTELSLLIKTIAKRIPNSAVLIAVIVGLYSDIDPMDCSAWVELTERLFKVGIEEEEL